MDDYHFVFNLCQTLLTFSQNQVITGKKTFGNSVTLSADLLADTVCGINMTELAETTVYNVGIQTITAHKTFIGKRHCVWYPRGVFKFL